jgi:hypothetical protein
VSLRVKRDLLFKSSDERKQIVLHDLRATMITLSLAHGKNEAWIMDRTGHKSSTQIQAYRREVALAIARKLPPLRPLNETIPELAGSKGGDSPKTPANDPQAPPRGTGKRSPTRAPKAPGNGAASATAPVDDAVTLPGEDGGAVEAIGPDSGTRLRDPASKTASSLVPLEVSSGREESGLGVSSGDLTSVRDQTPHLATVGANSTRLESSKTHAAAHFKCVRRMWRH